MSTRTEWTTVDDVHVTVTRGGDARDEEAPYTVLLTTWEGQRLAIQGRPDALRGLLRLTRHRLDEAVDEAAGRRSTVWTVIRTDETACETVGLYATEAEAEEVAAAFRALEGDHPTTGYHVSGPDVVGDRALLADERRQAAEETEEEAGDETGARWARERVARVADIAARNPGLRTERY